MGKKIQKIKRIKRIRIHREGNETLIYSAFILIAIAVVLWRSFESQVPFWTFVAAFGALSLIFSDALYASSLWMETVIRNLKS